MIAPTPAAANHPGITAAPAAMHAQRASRPPLGHAVQDPGAERAATRTLVASPSGGSRRGWVSLGICLLAVVAIWGWLLPAIGARDDVRASIEAIDRLGINPNAIFYTDVFESPAVGEAPEQFDNTSFSDQR